ncbi:endonuclease-reverse transcriptase [Holotrichia oblita]|uniref:Endonuclease-reverse transcriptase n=1 Tax=Holotrichia oblita TaxID=644536 RepID=A0ACB9T9N2_HOLOL|nr:endonuclease-reverse transcriptase [Holotrichia oblita]
MPSENYDLCSHKLERCDRPTRGGGVAIYIRRTLQYEIVSNFTSEYIEYLVIRLRIKSFTCMIGTFYRQPRGNYDMFIDCFENLLADMLLSYDNIICVGDFNTNMMSVTDYKTNALNELMSSLNLTQIIQDPTYRTTSSESLLDLVICGNSFNVTNSGTIDCSDMTDHYCVFCELPIYFNKLPPTQRVRTRSFKHFDGVAFEADVYAVHW